MYLLIDNYDSFTYNLADLVAETGRDVQVCRCDQIERNEIAALNPQGLIISPGPKRPEDAVHSLSIVGRTFRIRRNLAKSQSLAQRIERRCF